MSLPSVLVLGSNGMLGHRLLRTLRELGYQADGADRAMISAEEHHLLGAFLRWRGHDVVVNCIGWVRQRAFEGGPAEAISVNAVFPHRLSSACERLRMGLVHISTDCVGERDWYGASKMLGEAIEYGVVLRTSFIGHELDRRLGLLEWVLAQRGSVNGYARVLWNGLTTNELAEIIGRFLLPSSDLDRTWRYLQRGKVWNVCGPEITKLDLLELINQIYACGLDVVPVEEPVCDRRLDGRAFAERFGYEPPSWPDMIKAMRDRAEFSVPIAQEVVR